VYNNSSWVREPSMSDRKQKHPITVVSRRTGLSTHVIRAWENRYGVVAPERTPGNHRLYSDDDVQRLLALKRAKEKGRSIGQLASLSTKELLQLIAEDGAFPVHEPVEDRMITPERETKYCVFACLDAVRRLDADALWEALYRSSISLGQIAVMEDVIVPLMNALGEQWSEGSLRILHEHMASAVIRTYLGDLLRSLEVPESAPRAVAATLEGERHEIGALAAAVSASLQGWKVQYLGPNLPWEEIARTAEIFHAALVLISVIMFPEDRQPESDLKKLRAFIRSDVSIILGGNLPLRNRELLAEQGISYLADIRSLRTRLSAMNVG
jgi:DNA-binding transcriptional MerR regulator/methylmalonyl-CoA mutase cobalamin-binding subunit